MSQKILRTRLIGTILGVIGWIVALTLAPQLASGSVPLETIQGKVHFQKKTTVVPFEEEISVAAICQDSRKCPRPQTYWSMVVLSGGVVYELSRPFGFGEERRPEALEIAGVAVRPGSYVAVRGTIETYSPTYGVISDVKNISVMMDQRNVLHQTSGVDSIWSQKLEGWICQSVGPDTDTTFHARIWFGRNMPNEPEAYHLRVMAKQVIGNKLRYMNIASIEDLEVRSQYDQLIYRGERNRTEAMMAIRKLSQQIQSFPSLLKVIKNQTVGGVTIPVEGQVRMVCSPARHQAA